MPAMFRGSSVYTYMLCILTVSETAQVFHMDQSVQGYVLSDEQLSDYNGDQDDFSEHGIVQSILESGPGDTDGEIIQEDDIDHHHLFSHEAQDAIGNKEETSNTDFVSRTKRLKCMTPSSQPDPFREANSCKLVGSKIAHCSGINLSAVPPGLPSTIEQLYLNNNAIKTLTNKAFSQYNYTQLLDLRIDSNCLSYIHDNAFDGLDKLETLILTNNILIFDGSSFGDTVFKPLISLVKLELNLNNPNVEHPNTSYPDQALSHLKKLKSLYIDGLRNRKFGEGFSNLTSLVDLTLSGFTMSYCHVTSLYNDTFQYLTSLEYLSLQDCYLQGSNIEVGAFEPLVNLKTLSLTHNEDIGIENLGKVFYGLRNATRLKTLYLQLINNRYSLGACLSHKILEYFPPNVEYLDVQENNIEAVNDKFLDKLPKSMKILELSGNKFFLGAYLSNLTTLSNLKELRVNGGRYFYNLPTFYPYKSQSPYGVWKENASCSIYSGLQESFEKNHFVLQFPPNLTHIQMNRAGLAYKLSFLKVHSNNNVTSLSLSGNSFIYLLGPIHGFHNLKYLNLSRSMVRDIDRMFFQNLSSLTHLNLSINILGRCHRDPAKKHIYSDLINLEVLDLSYNDIYYFTPGILDELVSLKVLVLEKNILKTFDVDISRMLQLNYIGFRFSRIQSLYNSTMDAVDMLVKQGINITIDLSYSPILCECTNAHFLRWMTSSRAFDPKFKNYLCIYADGSVKLIYDQYEYTNSILMHECTSHTVLFFSVSSATTFLIIVIAISIIYRFRWKLRYLYYAAYLHYWKNSKGRSTTRSFDYDVFFSYHEDDEDFVLNTLRVEVENRHLKALVHKRDFISGEPISSNIVNAVCSSRKTLVVLTRSMVGSRWCNFEVQMATMESVSLGRPVLIFLKMSEIPHSVLGTELSYCIQNNTYLQYPQPPHDQNQNVMKNFWDRLVIDIRN